MDTKVYDFLQKKELKVGFRKNLVSRLNNYVRFIEKGNINMETKIHIGKGWTQFQMNIAGQIQLNAEFDKTDITLDQSQRIKEFDKKVYGVNGTQYVFEQELFNKLSILANETIDRDLTEFIKVQIHIFQPKADNPGLSVTNLQESRNVTVEKATTYNCKLTDFKLSDSEAATARVVSSFPRYSYTRS